MSGKRMEVRGRVRRRSRNCKETVPGGWWGRGEGVIMEWRMGGGRWYLWGTLRGQVALLIIKEPL